jgi:hypothetical protein
VEKCLSDEVAVKGPGFTDVKCGKKTSTNTNDDYCDGSLEDYDPFDPRIDCIGTGAAKVWFTVDITNKPPKVFTGGPYEVLERQTITLNASGSYDPEGDAFTYYWDLDDDGIFETSGPEAVFDAGSLDGPSDITRDLSVCDEFNACSDTVVSIKIINAPPEPYVQSGDGITYDQYAVILVNADDSDADKAAGFKYVVSWWNGTTDIVDQFTTGDVQFTSPRLFHAGQTYTFNVTAEDKDGGVTDPPEEFTLQLRDTDGDGIQDAVDVLPAEFSNDYSDELNPLNEISSGAILERGDQNLSIIDEPTKGVLIDTNSTDVAGNPLPAIINHCSNSANTYFDENERAIVTCGSVTIEVLKGTISTEFINNKRDATADIRTGEILSYNKQTLRIYNLGTEWAEVKLDGVTKNIKPGGFIIIKNSSPNKWDSRPTFGLSHETNSALVDSGFTFNSDSFSITNNFHTDFPEQKIEVGQTNSFSAKAYAQNNLKVQEFLFGIPNVGESHLAELGVEVWYGLNGEIEDIVVVQKSDVIDADTISVTHQKTSCGPSDFDEKCDLTTVSMTFLEPLKDKVMAIKAIDHKLRDHRTYLNDGFEVTGDSLNPMNTEMIPSNKKNQGLIQVTQTSKYSPYWQSDDGRTFEMNSFGSFKEIHKGFERFQDTGTAYTRLHSGFGGVMAYELNRATEIFDGSELLKELPDFIPYTPPEISERMTGDMKQKMQKQEEIAKEILEKSKVQVRW